ncbi:MAG: bifunctional diguanylate cyclase/phosphodiesterase, partial [Rubrivivax sp.]
RMGSLLKRAEHNADMLALLFIDLDNFKRVNDSLGHLEGDQVLTTVSERLIGALRGSDLVGRFGGDEFVVLLTDLTSRADVIVVLEALLSVVEVPVKADGRALSVTPSIGVAVFPDDGRYADELIQHADTAMYRAKAKGRATYQFFESSLAETAYADLVLEDELAQGLTRNEFELFFQPQVEATTGQLSGAEALLRWRHPVRGLLAPDAFISVAERHRLMLALGEWVLREAAATARRWREQGLTQSHGPMRIAVNLSRMQFNLDGFADTVQRVLAESGAKGQWIELELTERMLMDDIAHAPKTLAALRAQGLTVSVDDFGTGYTSLAHLTELPLDKLKIDQSFVARLPDDVGAQAITRAIVQMAVGLGLTVTAEG